MKLTPIKANMNEVQIDGLRVLVSYQTAVACYSVEGGYKKTSKYWSRTTSRHINQWLDGGLAQEVDQVFFDSILNEVE